MTTPRPGRKLDRKVVTGHCERPCSGCPWRKDTGMSLVPESTMLVCGSDDRPLMPDAPMMPCHKEYQGFDQKLCAAWLALYGIHHMGVRIQISSGILPPEVLDVKDDWPELHPDVESVIRASVEENISREEQDDDE